VKVAESGQGWVYLGRAPKLAPFGRSDPQGKTCLIRAGKPGYATEERSFPFASLPPEVHIALRPSGSGADTHGYFGINFVAMTEEAIALAAQQAAYQKANEAAAQAEHERMMKSYKQLDGGRNSGFKTLSDSDLDFKTLEGDMEAMAAGAAARRGSLHLEVSLAA